jgi:vitamin B12 transporter
MSSLRSRATPRPLVACACFAIASACGAQVPLGSVFVTAARMPQTFERLLADVTTIHADEIARSGAQSLADILARHPGIEITQNGGPASTTGIFIRGANRGQTLLLIDGLRVGSSTVGAPTPEAIPLDQIERIEILRGPASSLYGADAIGGVIQIFTRQPAQGFGGHASAGYGTYRTRTYSAGLTAAMGALRLSVQGGGRRSDGFNATTDPASFIYNEDRDGYESDDLGANATLTFAPGQDVSVQLLRNRLDAQFDSGPGFDDRTLTTLQTWQVVSRNSLGERWTSKLSAGESRDDSVSKTGFGDFPFRTRERQYAWQNEIAVPMGSVALALERREERIDEDAGFAVRERDTNAIVGVWQFLHAGHAIQANLRHDRSSQFGGETTGAIAWGWAFAPGWRTTASYGTAFKPPSFNDLYFPDFSNPDLVPERARNIEAGVHWQGNVHGVAIGARAVGWRNDVSDLIVVECDASFNCLPRNVASARLAGVTLATDLLWRDTSIKASIDLQDPEDRATGNLLPRRARQHGALVVTQALGPVRLFVELIASSHRFDDAANTRRLAGYAIVNVGAEWSVGHGVTLLLRGDNVGDRDYTLASGYATPGARAFVGVRWQP